MPIELLYDQKVSISAWSIKDTEDPPLDQTSSEDPPLGLEYLRSKRPRGKHQEGPTPGGATWEDQISEMIQEDVENQQDT